MKKLLFLFFILFGTTAYSQQSTTADNTNEPKDKIQVGSFENYAFLMDGKVIAQNKLVDYPKAKLYSIYPWRKTLEGKEYFGVVYFHANTQPQTTSLFADDPAWFLNSRQVSSLNIRETSPEYYTRIVKSTADTLIKGKLYKGSIYITTEEDYFSIRQDLTKILQKYNGIDLNQTVLSWFRPLSYFLKSSLNIEHMSDVSTTVQDDHSIYFLNKEDENIIRVNSLQFAKGKRSVIQIINRISFGRSSIIFDKPLLVDTEYPCYLINSDKKPDYVFQQVEVMPKPKNGEEHYLRKLALTLKLPNKKSSVPLISDSISVSFLVTNLELLADLESYSENTSANEAILHAIKKNACLWNVGLQGGRPVYTGRKMKIFYTKDPKGNIQSLDRLEFHSNLLLN